MELKRKLFLVFNTSYQKEEGQSISSDSDVSSGVSSKFSSSSDSSSGLLNIKVNPELERYDPNGNPGTLPNFGLGKGLSILINKKGLPRSNRERLVLHISTLTLQGIHQFPMRRRDMKVLRQLDPVAREIILEALDSISFLDYEYSSNAAEIAYSDILNFSRSRSKAQMFKRLYRSMKSLISSPKNTSMEYYNRKLAPFNIIATLVKREEKHVGTTVTVYYLLFQSRVRTAPLVNRLPSENS